MSVSLRGIEVKLGEFLLSLDLDIKKGEMMCLLGPSGCGKSTLLRTITGLQMPDRGRVFLEEEDITYLPTHLRGISMVFQDHALFPHMNVKDNVSYGLKVRNTNRQDIRETTARLLDLVHLSGYEERNIDTLSGGEQQRVALARALAVEPKLLLFDEPLSSLDAPLRVLLRNEIRNIQRSLGITAVYVSHDRGEALSLGDSVAVMKEGRIVQIGSPEQVYHHPADLFVASVTGRVNTLPGAVISSRDETVRVKTPFGEISGKNRNDPLLSPGRRITVCFRPEHAALSSAETGGTALTGRCVSVEFHGEAYRVELKAGGRTVWIDLSPDMVHVSGKELAFTVPEERVMMFPG